MSADTVESVAAPVAEIAQGRKSRKLPPILAVFIPTVLTAVHALAYGRWIVDDAGITFAYARSVAEGAGPVLQPGAAAVEGYSDPAWLAVLVGGRKIGLFDHGAWFGVPDYVLFPKGVALLCCMGIFICFYLAAAAVCRRPAIVAGVAGVVTAAIPSFVIWCFSGLENALLALIVVALATVLARAVAAGRLTSPWVAVWCGLLAALAALTRPDGIIYAAAYPLVALLFITRASLGRTIGAAALSTVVFLVPYGTYLAWRLAEFGAWVPNTALAKDQSMPKVTDLARAADLIGYVGWPAALLALGCVGAALAVPSRMRAGLAAVLVVLLLAGVAFAVLKGDWMPQNRFATPVWQLAALAAAMSAGEVLPRLATRAKAALAVLAALACALSVTVWWQNMQTFRNGPTVPLCVVAGQSAEYNEYARMLGVRDGTLLLPDIGATAMTSDLRVADVVGLADRRFAQYWADRNMAGLRDYVFTELRPTFIHLHGVWAAATGLLADPRMDAGYYLVRRGPSSGENLVRKGVVSGPQQLYDLRQYANKAAGVDVAANLARRGSCGPVLWPGR